MREWGNEGEKSGNYICRPPGHGSDPANAVISVVRVAPPLSPECSSSRRCAPIG
jgi:hypothetical protein